MSDPLQEIQRRGPVWEALSWLFLDAEFDDSTQRSISRVILESGYGPSEIQKILWEELFPVVGGNLSGAVGIWEGFDGTWLEEEILEGRAKFTPGNCPMAAGIIQAQWAKVAERLPDGF